MIRLVVTYVASDGFTYSSDVAEPITYKSAEDAIVDFEAAARESYLGQGQDFTFGGKQFYAGNFFACNHDEDWRLAKYYGPDFLTVDEWFDRP
jgi:hypothetical protein